MTIDDDVCYRALATRDARFDGRFFTCVTTTGVYCRPVCPAKTPRRANVRFVPTAAAAEAAGFRACLRCRPDAAPWTPAWSGTGATVARGLRLLDAAEGDDAALAARLGVGERHLRRLFLRHVGATPARIARTRRVHLARQLVETSAIPFTRIAFEAGFGSVRRFNEAFRASFGRSPTELRRHRGGSAVGVALRLPFRAPYDASQVFGFLAARAVAGVERVRGATYERALGAGALVRVALAKDGRALDVAVEGASPPRLLDLAPRVRRMFDLDADPDAIARDLARDPALRGLVSARPGLRIPGTWDAWEAAVRAVLGQQVTLVAGVRAVARLAAVCGEDVDPRGALVRAFPDPAAVATADLAPLGLTRQRAETLRAVAAAFASGALARDGRDEGALVGGMTSIRGVGPWTAQYAALRGCGAPDAFPSGDLVLRRAAGETSPRALERRAEAWRPWRGYAALHLWMKSVAAKEIPCESA